jgi:uncharacterized phage infection (PIP) family protein YhgE
MGLINSKKKQQEELEQLRVLQQRVEQLNTQIHNMDNKYRQICDYTTHIIVEVQQNLLETIDLKRESLNQFESKLKQQIQDLQHIHID